MKKIAFTLIMLMLVQASNAQLYDTLSFSLNDFDFETEGSYTRLSYIESFYTEDVGYPEMPCLKIHYVIPFDKQVSQLIVNDSTILDIPGQFLIYPRQSEISLSDPYPMGFDFDSVEYRSNNPYPHKTVELVDQYYEMGYHMALVHVYPFSYIPSLRSLRFCSSVSIALEYSDCSTLPIRPKMASRRMFETSKAMVKSITRNGFAVDSIGGGPLVVIEMNEPCPEPIQILSTSSERIPEYLIITNNRDIDGNLLEPYEGKSMTELFQILADWKTKKGVPAVVVSVDDICSNYTGNDTQARIHNFLADVYEKYGSMYVLLGGDTNIIPERMLDTITVIFGLLNTTYDRLCFASDLYYSGVNSSWDSNCNGKYGETTIGQFGWNSIDNSDDYPKFRLARIPSSNCYKAAAFINKNIGYEKMMGVNQEDRKYVNNITSLMAFLKRQNNPSSAPLTNFMAKTNNIFGKTEPVQIGLFQKDLQKWRGFESDSVDNTVLDHWRRTCKSLGVALFNENIPNTNGEKAHVIIHADHSSYQRLGTATIHRNESLDRGNVDQFNNAPYHKILFTYGCYPGDFTKDCIIEHLLNNPNGGVVAARASVSNSYSDKDNNIQSLLRKMYPLKYNNYLFDASYYKMWDLHYQFDADLVCKRKNHLFGDPELPVWTREPLDLSVNVSPQTISNTDTILTVSVSGMAYARHATNDVLVCLMKDGEIYQRAFYNDTLQSHDFVFHIRPETAGELDVTVAGHNYIPYETVVPVTITGRNAFVSNVKVFEELGNDDNEPNAGETIGLEVKITNNGSVNLAGVSATLSCAFTDGEMNSHIEDYLTVSVPSTSYGVIQVGETIHGDDFRLSFSNDVPDKSVLRCTLTVSDRDGFLSVKRFWLNVTSPNLKPVSVTHGQRNFKNHVNINIDIDNIGFGLAKSVTGELTSPNVQLFVDSVFFGNLGHLHSESKTFICIDTGNLEGAEFALQLVDVLGNSQIHEFTLTTVTDSVENLRFTSGERSIHLIWDPVAGSSGYHVYRSLVYNGDYERLDDYPFPSSAYTDFKLENMQTYHYAVSFLDEWGNESAWTHLKAWTTLPEAPGWPVTLPDQLGRPWATAPNAADVDGDGKKEIFITTGSGDGCEPVGTLVGLDHRGVELYDIDHNPTTVSGFASIGTSMTCTPAIGDIDNDGTEEIVVATRCFDSTGTYKIFVYKAEDSDTDGLPDLAWERPIDFSNFNGVVISDLDGDGTLEIVVPNQGKSVQGSMTCLEVFDCEGNHYYPKNTIVAPDAHNSDRKAVTMPVVADLDGDGHKEIVFGIEGGVLMWSCYSDTLTTLFSCDGERTDCPVVATDIDRDGELEVLYMAIRDGRGYLRAVNYDGTAVSGWSGDNHAVSLHGNEPGWEWPPYFCVADIDMDGLLEVLAADSDTVKMWTADGTAFGTGMIQVTNLDCRYFQPVVADIDGGNDCEIVIPSNNGYVYAFKSDGEPVAGWPLHIPELSSIPLVADLDGDGLNEVVATSSTEIHLWKTTGFSKLVPFGRFRHNRYNNAAYEQPCVHTSVPILVSDTSVWNHDVLLNKDLVIESGAFLTITSEVLCTPGTTIVVKPGGRLTIDGGRIACNCVGDLWQGIEVWGNRQAHQYPVNGIYAQGFLELKNGASLEDAECAVRLWRPGHWGSTGGIVKASNTSFVNNRMAVWASHYENYLPGSGKPTANVSFFRNCSFTVTNDYKGSLFHKHVTLSHVRGIKFNACQFFAGKGNVSNWSMGIHAIEAGFSVDGMCDSHFIPCLNYNRSLFKGFFMAVKAESDGSMTSPAVTIKHTIFSDNGYGVYLGKSEYASVLSSEFQMRRIGDFDCATGILLEETHYFFVEENQFQNIGNPSDETYGLIVTDSREQNMVYRNTFEGLRCANLATGMNTMKANEEFLGLEYGCNENVSNIIDFYSRGDIQTNQGSYDAAARNVFSENAYHFYNGGDGLINYFFYDETGFGDEEPTTYNGNRIVPVATDQTDGCPSNYGGSLVNIDTLSVVLTPYRRNLLEQEYAEAKTLYLQLKALYEDRIDGGSTPNMLYDIGNAGIQDVWELRASLLGASPYLSREVLFATLDKHDILCDTIIFEVLFSNPDELKRDTLMERIRNLEDPLPQYMVRILERVAEGMTSRTALQAEMSDARKAYTQAAGLIVRSILNDTVADVADLRLWLGNMESLEADRDIVSSYIGEGDFTDAFSLAGLLPALYELSGADLTEHEMYMQLLGLFRSLDSTGRNTMQLDSSEMATVMRIAERGSGDPKAMSEAILGNYQDGAEIVSRFVCPNVSLPEIGRNTENNPYSLDWIGKPAGTMLEMAPNPAGKWTEVRYTLPLGMTSAKVDITDMLGKRMASYVVEGLKGQKVIDLRSLPSGVYLVTLSCPGYQHTEKLVITK